MPCVALAMDCIPLPRVSARLSGHWSEAGSMIPMDTPLRSCSRAWSYWRVWHGSRCCSGGKALERFISTAKAVRCHTDHPHIMKERCHGNRRHVNVLGGARLDPGSRTPHDYVWWEYVVCECRLSRACHHL